MVFCMVKIMAGIVWREIGTGYIYIGMGCIYIGIGYIYIGMGFYIYWCCPTKKFYMITKEKCLYVVQDRNIFIGIEKNRILGKLSKFNKAKKGKVLSVYYREKNGVIVHKIYFLYQ